MAYRAEKPTEESIARFVSVYEQVLAQSVQKWTRNDTFFHQTFSVWPNHKTREAIHTPISKSRVLQPLKTQFSNEVRYSREPVGRAEDAEEWADLVENWLNLMAATLAMEENVSPYKSLVRQTLTYGKGVGEGLRWRTSPDTKEPEQAADEDDDQYEARMAAWEYDQQHFFPFKASVVHPNFFLANPYERNPSECVVRKSLRGYEIEQLVSSKQSMKRRYPNSAAILSLDVDSFDPGKDWNTLHDIEEHWNAGWHCLKLKSGRLIYREANRLGYVPYRQYYSGNGGEMGERSTVDPVDMAQGMYDGLEDLLRTIDQQASATNYMLVRKAFASVVFKNRGDNATKDATTIAHGDTIYGASPDDVGVIPYPDVTSDFFTQQQVHERMLTMGSFPEGILGQKQPGVDTGILNAQLTEAMNRIFDGEAQAQGDLAKWHGESALKLVDYYGEPVTIGTLTLEKKHIGHVYDVTAKFPNVDIATKVIESAKNERLPTHGELDPDDTALPQFLGQRADVHADPVLKEELMRRALQQARAEEAP